MTIFRFFMMAAAAILRLQIFEVLMVEQLKRVKVRRRAKFGQNRSNRGRDMTIFEFSKMAAVRHLGFCDACFRTTHEEHLVVFITVQNLVGIDTVVSRICKF